MTTNTANTNRLMHEASPYLLQHANNPVDWYPWGDEAFEKAKREDKPVFLSIGYSTCHWCHVMAHESFESEEVAEVLNSGFVSIKVDREQRPDVDEVYMSVCQAMTGSGGWPLSVFMTWDKQPFYAGTYFPKESKYGMPGFIELCQKIQHLYKNDKQSLLKSAEQIKAHIEEDAADSVPLKDTDKVIERGYSYLKRTYDKRSGGFSYSPKFPSAHKILFLLKYYIANGTKDALDMAEHTLKSMYRGGMFDHVGGGFSRYSTDENWLVPHFEKMLYDNATLLLAYSEAYSLTKDKIYSNILNKICDYVLRDMQSPKGGFFSAEDADSEGEEGKFYVFSYDELARSFSDEEMQVLRESFGVTRTGNFEGSNIINKLTSDLEETDQQATVRKKLYELREKRIRPFKDTKISASWNGLMIEALVRAGEATSNQMYIDSAKNAADFIINSMMCGEELFGIYKEGSLPSKAFLADYANFANALLALYSATLELKYLSRAQRLVKRMISMFFDREHMRFFMTDKDSEQLLIRPKDDYDGAMPSGNSSAFMCLVSLYNLTSDEDILKTLEDALTKALAAAADTPGAYLHLLSALLTMNAVHRQIIITAEKDSEEAQAVYRRIQREYLPFTTIIYYDGTDEAKTEFPQLKHYAAQRPFAAYVCENYACQSPVFSPKELLEKLGLS